MLKSTILQVTPNNMTACVALPLRWWWKCQWLPQLAQRQKGW